MTILDQETDPNLDFTDPEDSTDYLSMYVGEGKKYKDPAALAKAIHHKDAFIEQLKSETAGMREDLKARIKLEEFLDKLNSNTRDRTSNGDNQGREDDGTGKDAISPQDLDKYLTERERNAQRKQNQDMVQEVLQNKLGPNYSSKVRQIASEVGLKDADVENIAAENPKALFRILGIDTKPSRETFNAPPASYTLDTTTNSNKKTYKWFKETYKDPTEYWTPKVQNEMRQYAVQLGDEFYK